MSVSQFGDGTESLVWYVLFEKFIVKWKNEMGIIINKSYTKSRFFCVVVNDDGFVIIRISQLLQLVNNVLNIFHLSNVFILKFYKICQRKIGLHKNFRMFLLF